METDDRTAARAKNDRGGKGGGGGGGGRGPGGVDLPQWCTQPRPGWSLEMRHPEAEGASKLIAIDKARFTLVGRHEGEFNVVVDHVTVSRRHALLVHKGNAVFLYDMSSNGSSINGVPASKREYLELHAGDTLRFGDHPSTFMLTMQDAVLSIDGEGAPREASAKSTSTSKGDAPIPAKRRTNALSERAGGAGAAKVPLAASAGGQPSMDPLVVHGLKLHMGSKGLEVRTVEPGSVAESHPFPFSWGDLVISIDDADTSAMSKEEIRAALALGLSRDEVRLAIKKGGEVRQVALGGEGKTMAKAATADDSSSSWKVRLAGMLESAGSGAHEGTMKPMRAAGEGAAGVSGHEDPELAGRPNDARPSHSLVQTPTGAKNRTQTPAGARSASSTSAQADEQKLADPARPGRRNEVDARQGASASDSEGGGEAGVAEDVDDGVLTAELMAELSPMLMRKVLIDALQKQRHGELELCRRLRRILRAARRDWSGAEGSAGAGGTGTGMAGDLVHFLVEHTKPMIFSALTPASQELWLSALRVLPPADSVRPAVTHEGYLWKKGKRSRMWQRRFYIVRYRSRTPNPEP